MDGIFVESKLVNEKRIQSRIIIPDRLRKYFHSTEFFVEYEEEINDNPSILNIPIVSIILPVAWLQVL